MVATQVNLLATVHPVLHLGLKLHITLFRLIMTKLDSILKIRDITLPTKVHIVKAMVFPLVHIWM